MSKPASFAEFGTVVPSVSIACSATNHGRFADIKTRLAGAMPEVKVGQIYADLDPRCKGRKVQVLRVGGDGKVMVRTLTPRICAPRTPSKNPRDTTGSVSFIAQRRFKEGARGFRLLHGSPLRGVQSFLLASRLAAGCDIEVTEMETRTSDALIALLGNRGAHDYLDSLIACRAVRDLYLNGGTRAILIDALKFADEADSGQDYWVGRPVASRSTARFVSLHV